MRNLVLNTIIKLWHETRAIARINFKGFKEIKEFERLVYES